jgi:hypothetical protein
VHLQQYPHLLQHYNLGWYRPHQAVPVALGQGGSQSREEVGV